MAVFISKRTQFNNKNEQLKDMVLARLSMGIEIAIKTTAGTPVKTGGMKSEVRSFKNSNSQWRVEANKNYSAAQEAGYSKSGTKFKNYTTPGTSAGWFRRAINSNIKNADQYVRESSQALNL